MGYDFDCSQGIFSTLHDAWQGRFGYTYSFDRFAPFFNMVFDALPVYFDYDGKTWLIEFWKGQYGITTGAEIGVYYADELIPEADRKKAIFKVVEPQDMLNMSFSLRNDTDTLAGLSDIHWWLTAFRLGIFNHPKHLLMDIRLTFPNRDMLSAFIHAMFDLGYNPPNMCVNGQTLLFTFEAPVDYNCNILCRFNRRFALWRCKMLCKLFNRVTRPFTKPDDRLLYLYFYLPFVFRRILLLHARNHKNRKQHKKLYKTFRRNITK